MTTNVPEQVLEDAHKLEADGIVELFKLELVPSGVVYLKADDSVEWQGNLYEGWGIQMGGVSNTSDEEAARPQLVLANPDGIISALVGDNQLIGSLVTRYRVLREDLLANRNRFTRQMFKIYRTVTLNKTLAVFECRNLLDAPLSMIPARMYMPPDFPYVSLS